MNKPDQLFDPKTYEVTIKYLNRPEVSVAIRAKITSGEIVIPPEYALDPGPYVKGLIDAEMRDPKVRYQEAFEAAHAQFIIDQERKHGMMDWPKVVREEVHRLAWEEGHGGGFTDASNCYHEFVDLVRLAYQNPPPPTQGCPA